MTMLRTYRLSSQQCLSDRSAVCLLLSVSLQLWISYRLTPAPVIALPPPEDLPEEILRTEIITEARSPIDGQPLTAAEYALYADKEYNVETRNFPSLPSPDGSPIACPQSDFLPCPNYNPALPDQNRPFAAANHIINKFPIRDLLRRMFPF